MGFDPLGAVEALFGGGGGGGGGAGGYYELLAWMEDQQQRLEELDERERETAEARTSLRRGELLDRPGFSGLVNVGDAVQRSDATLAAEMETLAADDPTRLAYEDALATERAERGKQKRMLTGEYYEAEDAFAALRERLDAPTWSYFGTPVHDDIRDIQSEYEDLISRYGDFYEPDGDFLSDIEAGVSALDRLEEQRRRNRQASGRGNSIQPRDTGPGSR